MFVQDGLPFDQAVLDFLHRGPRQRSVWRRLCLELLEERTVPTVIAVPETFTTTPTRTTSLNVVDQAVLNQSGTSDSGVSLVQVGAASPSGATLNPIFYDGTVTFNSSTTGTYTFHYNLSPTAQQVAASDGRDADSFGASVAVDGGMAVIGAPNHGTGGAVYVFTLSGSTWTQQAELTASDTVLGDQFGSSVAISGSVGGTTIVVGAPDHKVGSNPMQGAVYVFTSSGTTWTQQQELTASDGAADDNFGSSVAIDNSTLAPGTTLVVGAAKHSVGSNASQGAAYVFAFANSTWTQQQELTASDGAANDNFGTSVAIDGSSIVVGASKHQVGTNAAQGAAYVFASSGTTWAQQQELTAADGAANDNFGTSVGISLGTVLVGAPDHQGKGAAYVFAQNGTTWTQQQELTAGDTVEGFGSSVAISDNFAVVGDPTAGYFHQGAAYTFAFDGITNTWIQQQEINPPLAVETEFGDRFGSSVAVAGDFALAGGAEESQSYGLFEGGAAFQSLATSSSTVTVQVVDPVSASRTVGVFDPRTATWYLNGSNAAGTPTAGQFQYGAPGWIALTGDFTGDGQTTLVVVDPTTETWYISNNLGAGPPSFIPFQYGEPGWIPVVGDWNGSGIDGIGVVDTTTGTWYLRNEISSGYADSTFVYGAPGWIPVVGNWAGTSDGQDGIGMVDPSTETWYLRNTPGAGAVSDTPFQYGEPGWTPVVGNWSSITQTGIGVYDSTGTFYLRNETSAGGPDAGQFVYGGGGWTPLGGQWKSPLNAPQNQFAAGIGPGAEALSNAMLQSTVQEALVLLSSAGVNPALLQQLGSANYEVAALPQGVLGETFVATHTVFISADAAGFGWYTDSAAQDSIFGSNGTAVAGSPAAGEEDLLTTVLHEMGHLAGQPDVNNVPTGPNLMDAILPLGVRRIDALDQVFASGTFV